MAALLGGGSAPSRSHHPRAGQTASVGERAPCLLLPPPAALTDGPVPWSRLSKTLQRLCKTFSLLWLTVGAFPGLSSSTRSCCTLSGKPNPLHVPRFLISQTGGCLGLGFPCRIPKGALCWGSTPSPLHRAFKERKAKRAGHQHSQSSLYAHKA